MDPLLEVVQHQTQGNAVGVYSVCSSNLFVLEAAMLQAKKDGSAVLIEPTVNQVNQFGGYTGKTPSQFVAQMKMTADRLAFPFDQAILGGDHLGPNPWKDETAAQAMEKSRTLVEAYVSSGFRKIHLDTSIRCADDPGDPHTPMDDTIVAKRAVDLCKVAEETYHSSESLAVPPVYVIGTEVPVPGGAEGGLEAVEVTTVEAVKRTIEVTEGAFLDAGLEDAWDRVIATVVQPGVEFGDTSVQAYNREEGAALSSFIEGVEGMIFEAHSTDYQLETDLKDLTADHFAILKVGPWLTYAFRETVFALAMIEQEWLGSRKSTALSELPSVLEEVMLQNPQYWDGYYQGTEFERRFARKYSYSDRSRYYWQSPRLQSALQQLFSNLRDHPAPLTILSQFLPNQYKAVRRDEITREPTEIIHHKIMEVLGIYSRATRFRELFR